MIVETLSATERFVVEYRPLAHPLIGWARWRGPVYKLREKAGKRKRLLTRAWPQNEYRIVRHTTLVEVIV